jgi:hypothetical protein
MQLLDGCQSRQSAAAPCTHPAPPAALEVPLAACPAPSLPAQNAAAVLRHQLAPRTITTISMAE